MIRGLFFATNLHIPILHPFGRWPIVISSITCIQVSLNSIYIYPTQFKAKKLFNNSDVVIKNFIQVLKKNHPSQLRPE